MTKKIIAVIGASVCDAAVRKAAYEAGRLIAKQKAAVICGGYGGVMEAASRGAKSAGGLTIGILSGKDPGEANRWIDIPIVTGMRDARNVIILRSAHGAIAVSGGFGTLSEIGFALKFKVPLVGLGTWSLSAPGPSSKPPFPSASSPQEAVDILFRLI